MTERIIFIIDDQRHEDYCFELNGITRQESDIVILARSALSASIAIMKLADYGVPIDIIMLDHDLGDGRDTTWWLNWLLGLHYNDPIAEGTEEVLTYLSPYLEHTQWFYHTSNTGTIPTMKDKVADIKAMIDENMARLRSKVDTTE